MTVASVGTILQLPPEIFGPISLYTQDANNALAKTCKRLYNTKETWAYRCSDIYSKWLHAKTNSHSIIDKINQKFYQEKLIIHIDYKRLNIERFKKFIAIKNPLELHVHIDEQSYDKLLQLWLKQSDSSLLINNIKAIHLDQTTQVTPDNQDINCDSLRLIQQSFPKAEYIGFTGRSFRDTAQHIQQYDFSKLTALNIDTISQQNFLEILSQALHIKKLAIDSLSIDKNNIQRIPVLADLEELSLGLSVIHPAGQVNETTFDDIVELLEKTPSLKILTLPTYIQDTHILQNQPMANNVHLPQLKELYIRPLFLNSLFLSFLLSRSPHLEGMAISLHSTTGTGFALNEHTELKKLYIVSRYIYADQLSQFLKKFPKLETLSIHVVGSFSNTDFSDAPNLPDLKTIHLQETSSYPRIQSLFSTFTRSYRALRSKYPNVEILHTFQQRQVQNIPRHNAPSIINKIARIFFTIVAIATYISLLTLFIFTTSINKSNANSVTMLLNRVRQLRFVS